MNEDQPELHLYVDATIDTTIDTDEPSRTVVSFGPFSTREAAERALIAFMGRENAIGARIRNPDGA